MKFQESNFQVNKFIEKNPFEINNKIKFNEEKHFNLKSFVKLQSYNFPTTLHTLNNEYLEQFCNYLKKEYIFNNGIDEFNRLDMMEHIEKIINYNKNIIIDPHQLIENLEKHNSFNFNFEEQFLINRVYYSEVKKFGFHVNSSKILNILVILQVNYIFK